MCLNQSALNRGKKQFPAQVAMASTKGAPMMHTRSWASRQRLYKGRYLIVLCDDDETALTRYSLANIAEFAALLGITYNNAASKLSHALDRAKGLVRVGRRFLTVGLVEVEADEIGELEEGYGYAG